MEETSEPLAPLIDESGEEEQAGELDPTEQAEEERIHPVRIAAILATAFSYGFIIVTIFTIVIPIECTRIQQDYPSIQKGVSLGVFAALSGVCQLIGPLLGMMSDNFMPPTNNIGQRLPYLVFGSFFAVLGLIGQWFFSVHSVWIGYTFALVSHMIGINIVYGMMVALVPDQVPRPQTGKANGTLALLLVMGSLFGYVTFRTPLATPFQNMYLVYASVAFVAALLTCLFAHERDVALAWERKGSNNQPDRERANPCVLLGAMLVGPFRGMDWTKIRKSYTIDRSKYHDFFIVTVSRTFYYLGISVQSFFLYFLHDIIHQEDPQQTLASLAILSQIAGAVTCYPVGVISDKMVGGGQRRTFVYLACAVMASTAIALIFCKTVSDVLILGVFFGAGNGMYLTMDTSLAVDTLPDEHDNEGSGNAQLLGVWGVAAFVGSAVGPLIGGPLLYLIGHEPIGVDGIQTYSIVGYGVVLGLTSCYFVASALILKFFIKNPNI